MTARFKEGELELDFAGAVSVEQLDRIKPKPEGLKLVDFVVEEDRRILLVEVKDPLPEGIPHERRDQVIEREIGKLKTKELINSELVPKARDSYCFLHLMNRDGKPMHFIFLSGADRLGVTKELLLNFRDRLMIRLRKEANAEWRRQYVRDCSVLTQDEWNTHFGVYRVKRV